MENKLDKNHISLMSGRDIRSIVQPFLDFYNLKLFAASRIYPDGSTFLLTSHPEVFEFVFNEKFERIGSGEAGRHDLGNGWFLLSDMLYIDVYRTQTDILKERFKIDQDIYYSRQCKDYAELFMFTAFLGQYGVLTTYLNNLDIFEKFIDYFESKAEPFYQKSELKQNRVMFQTSRKDHTQLEKFVLPNKREILFQQFNKKTNIILANDKNIALTRREIECLSYLSKGMSMKEVAAKMFLSARTVSVHFKNIKNKLECYSKSKIIGLFRSQLFSEDSFE